MGLGKLVLRATLGGYFFGHGMQKLAGWFGGGGLEGTGHTGVMTNAIRHVHAQNGLWVTDGGVEYPAVILAVLAALADSGPGRFSLDEALGIRLRGPVVTAVAMGAGAAGAVCLAEHGQELFKGRDADEALSRSAEQVGAES